MTYSFFSFSFHFFSFSCFILLLFLLLLPPFVVCIVASTSSSSFTAQLEFYEDADGKVLEYVSRIKRNAPGESAVNRMKTEQSVTGTAALVRSRSAVNSMKTEQSVTGTAAWSGHGPQ